MSAREALRVNTSSSYAEGEIPRPSDLEEVARLLGRKPCGPFSVVVRRADGTPAVLQNAPILEDGRPMPTLFWLVDPLARETVSRLESNGGVKVAESAVDCGELMCAHDGYATERDAKIPSGYSGPRPSGGVGGTRRGVKCLHAHLAWWLAGGDDPVGRWVAEEIELDVSAYRRTPTDGSDQGSSPGARRAEGPNAGTSKS